MRRLVLAPIVAYQRVISPALPRRCKYEPTCSAYAVQAIRELGPFRGSVVAGWRLLRCNPLSDGGIDDLEDRTLFREHPHPHADGEESPSGSDPDRELAGAAR